MMYFLSVVLIGTIYPIFLEVLINEKISIGPPFFNKYVIPFLAVFLIFMSIGPKLNWIKDNFEKAWELNERHYGALTGLLWEEAMGGEPVVTRDSTGSAVSHILSQKRLVVAEVDNS